MIQALRLIGNSCADTNENRDRVIASGQLPTIVRLVADDSVLGYVIPVIYNMCVDYDPAQDAAFNSGLGKVLYDLISGPRCGSCVTIINLIAQILAFFASKEPDPALVNLLTPAKLLDCAKSPIFINDLEGFITVTTAVTLYLANPAYHLPFLNANCMPCLLDVFENAINTWAPGPNEDPDLIVQHKSLVVALLNTASDLSGLDAFTHIAESDSKLKTTILAYLASMNPDLQTLACLILGNMARSDQASAQLVRTHKAHIAASDIIATPLNMSRSTLLHSALGLLKNLSVASYNKPLIGPCLLGTPTAPGPLSRLWSLDTLPQVQFQSVSLSRSLCTGCPANVRALLTPLSLDPSSPASGQTQLAILLDLFCRADAEPTKVECARCVLTVCRALHSVPLSEPLWPTLEEVAKLSYTAGLEGDRIPKTLAKNSATSIEKIQNQKNEKEGVNQQKMTLIQQEESLEQKGNIAAADVAEQSIASSRSKFYDFHSDIPRALSLLVSQDKWPALRSESWFVFALMAGSHDGARVVMKATMTAAPMMALQEALTGEKTAKLLDVLTGNEKGEGEGVEYRTSNMKEQEQLLLKEQLLRGNREEKDENIKNKKKGMKVDRENAIVLTTELLRNFPEMPPMKKNVMEMQLKKAVAIMEEERKGETT